MNNASYYVMKNGIILRTESPLDISNIPKLIQVNLLEPTQVVALNQAQANHRVLTFRDEILEYNEYSERVSW